MNMTMLIVAVVTANFATTALALTPPTQQSNDQFKQHHEYHHGMDIEQYELAPTAILPLSPSDLANNQSMTCDIEAFMTTNSRVLINEIIAQGTECINLLFSVNSSIQESVFDSHHMHNVAFHTASSAKSYAGGGSGELEALYLYLRAGYYVEFYNDNVSFASWVTPVVRQSIDAFVANAHFYENSDAHGKVLSEVIITMDSADLQHVYLSQVTQWLTLWNDDYAQSWYMRNAVNGVFTILFRGQHNAQFVDIIGDQMELVNALGSFALRDSSIGASDEFMAANAGRELGRMTHYSGSASSTVKRKINEVFARYKMYGKGDAVWLATASAVSDCSVFKICNFEAELKPMVLSQSYYCSSTIRILSQNMTQAQHIAACSKMGYEESDFHQSVETKWQPVKDDYNTQLQVNIFDSSSAYSKYAGPIFNISTNNGGMYLEGDPSLPGNIPNFVAYEATYANPEHWVWNLEHEYVHYLDGRFDLYGDFNHPTEKVVWWSEGIAEYIAKGNNNQDAIDTIKDGSTYTLNEIFETTYDGFDVDRIYRWGYLAVRFMFEKHKQEVNSMLQETRQGNWKNYKSVITQWSTRYQNEFEQWQVALTSEARSKAR